MRVTETTDDQKKARLARAKAIAEKFKAKHPDVVEAVKAGSVEVVTPKVDQIAQPPKPESIQIAKVNKIVPVAIRRKK